MLEVDKRERLFDYLGYVRNIYNQPHGLWKSPRGWSFAFAATPAKPGVWVVRTPARVIALQFWKAPHPTR
jgi:hypothetical protein